MKTVRNIVDLKGKQSFLEIHLDSDSDFDLLREVMIKKLEAGGSFFVGGQRVEIVGKLTSKQQEELSNLLKERFSFSDVGFSNEATDLAFVRPAEGALHSQRRKMPIDQSIFARPIEEKSAARVKSILSRTKRKEEKVNLAPEGPLFKREAFEGAREGPSLMVDQTIRNGQRLEYDGHIVVLGDVNMGAELVATGNIIVLGTLRGKAHAGSAGDESATVIALQLMPQQLRIAARIAIAPQGKQKINDYPEQALIHLEEIVVTPLLKKNQ